MIEEIILSEDTQKIERTMEPSGTPYNFKKVVILITSPKTDEVISRTIYTKFTCGSRYGACYVSFKSDLVYSRRCVFRGQIENSELRISIVDCSYIYSPDSTISQSGDASTHKERPTCFIVTDNISKVETYCSSEKYIPAGFSMKIYGVRS